MHKPLISLFLALMFVLTACPTDSKNITGITAKATPTTVPSGGNSNLTANVNGTSTFNTGVTWSLVLEHQHRACTGRD